MFKFIFMHKTFALVFYRLIHTIFLFLKLSSLYSLSSLLFFISYKFSFGILQSNCPLLGANSLSKLDKVNVRKVFLFFLYKTQHKYIHIYIYLQKKIRIIPFNSDKNFCFFFLSQFLLKTIIYFRHTL